MADPQKTRRPNKYHETDKVVMRRRRLGDGVEFSFNSKEEKDAPLKVTHLVLPDRIEIFVFDSPLELIIFDGQFTPAEFKSLKDIQNPTNHLFNGFGAGFDDKRLRRFFKRNLPTARTVRIGAYSEPVQDGDELRIKHDDLMGLISDINIRMKADNQSIYGLIGNFWKEHFPKLDLMIRPQNPNKSLILGALNDRLKGQLTAEEVDQLIKFAFDAASKHKRAGIRRARSLLIAKRAQRLTLEELISRYEKLLQDDPPESVWQKLFNEYVTIFDTRYVQKIDAKNIGLGSTKYPDLVLVDVYGFIDFYELKRVRTPLLKHDSSHNNFYWTTDISMVISQAANYLQLAKSQAATLSSGIKAATAGRERDGLDVQIVNPRAVIVAGSSNELNTNKKREQFKILRESLKDIDFVLYDELLIYLKNLLSKVSADD